MLYILLLITADEAYYNFGQYNYFMKSGQLRWDTFFHHDGCCLHQEKMTLTVYLLL